jgi:hypothetical protein
VNMSTLHETRLPVLQPFDRASAVRMLSSYWDFFFLSSLLSSLSIPPHTATPPLPHFFFLTDSLLGVEMLSNKLCGDGWVHRELLKHL